MPPPDTPAKRAPRKRSIWFRATFGLVTFGLLFLLFDPRETLHHLAEIHGEWVVAGFLLALAGLFVRAYRWRLLLRHLGLRVSYWRTVEVYMISFWFYTFLPGSMGGDIYRIYDVARASSIKLRPTVAVVAERAAGFLALLLVATVAISLFHAWMPFSVPLYALVLAGVAGGLGGILVGLFHFDRLWGWLTSRAGFLNRLVRPDKVDGMRAICVDLRSGKWFYAGILGVSLVIQMLALTSYYALAVAITPSIPAVFFFTLFPLIEIASYMPVTVNGIGVKEGLLVYFLRMAAVSPSFSMSLGILYRLLALAFAVMGGLLLLLRKPEGWAIRRAPPPGDQPSR